MTRQEILDWFESHKDVWGIRGKVEKMSGISQGYIWYMTTGRRKRHNQETLNRISEAIKDYDNGRY